MKDIALIFLLALVAVCHAGWSKPTKIFNGNGVATSIYIDPLTNITHLGYSQMSHPPNMDSYNIYYRSIDPKGVLSNELFFDTGNPLYRITITGAGNGKNLYVTAFGPRGSFNELCNKTMNNTQYCYDIYTSESTDGGKTWKDFVRVERDNMDDATRRMGETTFFIKETGRVYVFYTVGSYEEYNGIAYVTRPANSTVFSKETIIFKRSPSYVNAGVGAAYTMKGGKPVLHVVWEEIERGWKSDKNYYTESYDMGLTWSKPRIIVNNASGSLIVIPVARLFSNTEISPSTLFLVYTDGDRIMHMQVSHDNGKTFGGDVKITKPGEIGHTAVVTFAGDKKNNLAFIAHAIAHYENALSFFVYNLTSEKMTELDTPFAGEEEILSPWIDVSYNPKARLFHTEMFASWYGQYVVGGLESSFNLYN